MSDLLSDCQEYEFEGKRYMVAPRDIYIEKQLSKWVMAEAALALDRLRDSVPPQFLREQMQIYSSKVAGKQFDWGSADCYNASTSEEGELQLLYLKMKRGESKGGMIVERELLDRIKKNKDKWHDLLAILYQQDYPEQYESFLSLIGRKSQKKSAGTTPNTGATSPPTAAPQSQA